MVTYLGKKWQLRLFYTTQPATLSMLSHEHRVYLNIEDGAPPGAGFDEYEVQTRSGVIVALSTYTDTYLDLVEPILPSTTQLIRVELWGADVATEDWVFYSVLAVGHVGSAAGAAVSYTAQIVTFRTQDGKSMRLQYAETAVAAGVKDPYPFANAATAALAAHVSGSASAVVNKYFSFPIAPINNCIEQHERYWDERQR